MSDLDLRNKEWLAKNLAGVSHGEKGRIAGLVGISATKLSRMANVNPRSGPKNTQTIPLAVLRKLAEIFPETEPPGLVVSREVPAPVSRRTRESGVPSNKPRVRRSLDGLVKNATDDVFDLAFDIVKLVAERGAR